MVRLALGLDDWKKIVPYFNNLSEHGQIPSFQ